MAAVSRHCRPGVDPYLHHPPVAAQPQSREDRRLSGIRVAVARIGDRSRVQREGVLRSFTHQPIMQAPGGGEQDPTPTTGTAEPGALRSRGSLHGIVDQHHHTVVAKSAFRAVRTRHLVHPHRRCWRRQPLAVLPRPQNAQCRSPPPGRLCTVKIIGGHRQRSQLIGQPNGNPPR